MKKRFQTVLRLDRVTIFFFMETASSNHRKMSKILRSLAIKSLKLVNLLVVGDTSVHSVIIRLYRFAECNIRKYHQANSPCVGSDRRSEVDNSQEIKSDKACFPIRLMFKVGEVMLVLREHFRKVKEMLTKMGDIQSDDNIFTPQLRKEKVLTEPYIAGLGIIFDDKDSPDVAECLILCKRDADLKGILMNPFSVNATEIAPENECNSKTPSTVNASNLDSDNPCTSPEKISERRTLQTATVTRKRNVINKNSETCMEHDGISTEILNRKSSKGQLQNTTDNVHCGDSFGNENSLSIGSNLAELLRVCNEPYGCSTSVQSSRPKEKCFSFEFSSIASAQPSKKGKSRRSSSTEAFMKDNEITDVILYNIQLDKIIHTEINRNLLRVEDETSDTTNNFSVSNEDSSNKQKGRTIEIQPQVFIGCCEDYKTLDHFNHGISNKNYNTSVYGKEMQNLANEAVEVIASNQSPPVADTNSHISVRTYIRGNIPCIPCANPEPSKDTSKMFSFKYESPQIVKSTNKLVSGAETFKLQPRNSEFSETQVESLRSLEPLTSETLTSPVSITNAKYLMRNGLIKKEQRWYEVVSEVGEFVNKGDLTWISGDERFLIQKKERRMCSRDFINPPNQFLHLKHERGSTDPMRFMESLDTGLCGKNKISGNLENYDSCQAFHIADTGAENCQNIQLQECSLSNLDTSVLRTDDSKNKFEHTKHFQGTQHGVIIVEPEAVLARGGLNSEPSSSVLEENTPKGKNQMCINIVSEDKHASIDNYKIPTSENVPKPDSGDSEIDSRYELSMTAKGPTDVHDKSPSEPYATASGTSNTSKDCREKDMLKLVFDLSETIFSGSDDDNYEKDTDWSKVEKIVEAITPRPIQSLHNQYGKDQNISIHSLPEQIIPIFSSRRMAGKAYCVNGDMEGDAQKFGIAYDKEAGCKDTQVTSKQSEEIALGKQAKNHSHFSEKLQRESNDSVLPVPVHRRYRSHQYSDKGSNEGKSAIDRAKAVLSMPLDQLKCHRLILNLIDNINAQQDWSNLQTEKAISAVYAGEASQTQTHLKKG